MNRQEIYDILVQGANDETLPGFQFGRCFYKKGLRHCAIGILVPENQELQPIEDLSFSDQPMNFQTWFMELTGFSRNEAQNLQDLHDRVASSTNFKEKFIQGLNKLDSFKDVNQYQA